MEDTFISRLFISLVVIFLFAYVIREIVLTFRKWIDEEKKRRLERRHKKTNFNIQIIGAIFSFLFLLFSIGLFYVTLYKAPLIIIAIWVFIYLKEVFFR